MLTCEVCREEFPTALKVVIDNEIFVCCADCKKQIDDINTANLIGEHLKKIIDAALKNKKNNLQ